MFLEKHRVRDRSDQSGRSVERMRCASKYVWGLIINETKCTLCAGNESGKTLQKWEANLRTYQGNWMKMLNDLTILAKADISTYNPQAIGIICGGSMDCEKGIIHNQRKVFAQNNVAITDYLSNNLGIPAFLEHDANACALAEWHHGAGLQCQRMAYLMFGTELRIGHIIGGKLYAGNSKIIGPADSSNQMRLSKASVFEGFNARSGLQHTANRVFQRKVTIKELVELSDDGNENAIRVFTKSAVSLGQGLNVLIDLLVPEQVVIGSMYARTDGWFYREMIPAIRRRTMEQSLNACKIAPAQLGRNMGEIAALTVAWNGLRRQK